MKDKIKGALVLKAVKFVFSVLPKEEKKKSFSVVLLLLINSFIELLGLAALLPLFSIVLKENVVDTNPKIKLIYDFLGCQSEKQFIIYICISVVIVFVIKNLVSILIIKKQSLFALNLSKKFSLKTSDSYNVKGYEYVSSENANQLAFNIINANQIFAQKIVLGLLNLFNEIVIIIVIITTIGIYNPWVLLVLLVAVVPIFSIFYLRVKKETDIMGNVQKETLPALSKDTYQSIYGYVDIKIGNNYSFFREKISNKLSKLVKVNSTRNVLNMMPTKVIETCLILAIAVIIVFGIWYYPDRSDLISLLGLFAVAGYRVMPSINRVMIAIMGVQESVFVFDVIGSLKDVSVDSSVIKEDIVFESAITLKDLSYAYPNTSKSVFEGVNVKINKGEVIGLVGESGAGKSTVMKLLLGLNQPKSGSILIDDVELTSNNMESYYEKLGYVQQQVYLIDGSIRENIAFGIPFDEVDDEKVIDALTRASLLDFYNDLEDDLDSHVGENGVKLSGGQRQRIGIARALYRNAEILFFDEATSALDDETEMEITDSINRLNDGSLTMVIIAHRKSTLKFADKVYKIENGELILIEENC